MAGIYEIDPSGMPRFSILTTDSNEIVSRIHDRMPVILPPALESLWLATNDKPENYLDILRPFPESGFTDRVISPKINSSINDSPDLLEPGPKALF